MNPWGAIRAVYDGLFNRGVTRLAVALVLGIDVLTLAERREHRVLCGLMKLSAFAPRRPITNDGRLFTVIRREGRAEVVTGWAEGDGELLGAAEREGRVADFMRVWQHVESVGFLGPVEEWTVHECLLPGTTIEGVTGAPLTAAEQQQALDSFEARLRKEVGEVRAVARSSGGVGAASGGVVVGGRFVVHRVRVGWLIHDVAAGGLVLLTFVLPAVQGAFWAARKVRGNRRLERGECPACGYDLKGRAGRAGGGEPLCPECGAPPSAE